MTTLEAAKLIGTIHQIVTNCLYVHVTVLDVKSSYGKTRYLVTPVAGSSKIWVETIHPI